MKVTGISIIKNAVINNYPIVEAITSVLSLVDEMIVLIGDSEDDTEGLIKCIPSQKINIVHSVWDKNIRSGGSVLAVETNKALQLVSPDTEWILYIQGDEVLHENDYPIIIEAMKKYADDKKVDGLLFHYLHFYATYEYLRDGRNWYKQETRIIRNRRNIMSYRDAQGFRIGNEKINVAQIPATVYHYGWVKHPKDMKTKQKNVAEFWEADDNALNDFRESDDFFDFNDYDSVQRFKDTHPTVMQERIQKMNWKVELDVKRKKIKWKYRLLKVIQRLIGKDLFVFKNHKLIRKM